VCDKRRDGDGKMSAVDVNAEVRKVKGWAEYLLNKESTGVRDTIEHAALQVEIKWRIPSSLLLRCIRRDIEGMKAKNWLLVKLAYDAAVASVQRAANHQQHIADTLRHAPDMANDASDLPCSKALLLGDRQKAGEQ
jgi:hypothetical protein